MMMAEIMKGEKGIWINLVRKKVPNNLDLRSIIGNWLQKV